MTLLVQGLMVTGATERRPLLRHALASIAAQTWPRLELLIVNWGAPLAAEILPEGLAVREIPAPVGRTIGELRNLALRHAHPDALLCQFDDDDWSGPNRVTHQVEAWESHGRPAAVVVQNQILLDVAGRLPVRVIEAHHWACGGFAGSVLCRGRLPVRYPRAVRGEDTELLNRLQSAGGRVVGFDNDPRDFVRVVHGGNTCSESHFTRLLQRSREATIAERQLAEVVSERLKQDAPSYISGPVLCQTELEVNSDGP